MARRPFQFKFYNNITFIKVAYFPSIYYHTPLKDHEVRGATVAAASHVRTSAMLLLQTVGIRKYNVGVPTNGIIQVFIPSFVKIDPIQKVEQGTLRHTQPDDLIRLQFFVCGYKNWAENNGNARSIQNSHVLQLLSWQLFIQTLVLLMFIYSSYSCIVAKPSAEQITQSKRTLSRIQYLLQRKTS